MKPEMILETERVLPSEFRSAVATFVFEPAATPRSRVFGVELTGSSPFGLRRGNLFQPQDDVMEELEWRMGL